MRKRKLWFLGLAALASSAFARPEAENCFQLRILGENPLGQIKLETLICGQGNIFSVYSASNFLVREALRKRGFDFGAKSLNSSLARIFYSVPERQFQFGSAVVSLNNSQVAFAGFNGLDPQELERFAEFRDFVSKLILPAFLRSRPALATGWQILLAGISFFICFLSALLLSHHLRQLRRLAQPL